MKLQNNQKDENKNEQEKPITESIPNDLGKQLSNDSVNNNIKPNKKKLIKRYWWIFIIFFVIFTGIITYFKVQDQISIQREKQKQANKVDQSDKYETYKYVEPTMTDKQLETAEQVLVNGVVIDDSSDDFAIPGDGTDAIGRTDNKQAYSLGWNDLKKVTFNADNDNFYVRYDFYGTFPNEMITINGDDIKSFECNLALISFTTTSDGADEGLMQVGISYVEGVGKGSLGWSTEYTEISPRLGITQIASPNGQQDQYGETTYETSSSSGAVYGGLGKDYIIVSFALNGLKVLPGSEIIFDITVETNSKVYHHSSIDPLLDFGSEKSGLQIIYTLGSNTYSTRYPLK